MEDISRASIPTFFLSPDGSGAHCGVSFIVRSALNVRWLVTCAHIAGRGKATPDFATWCRRLNLRISPSQVATLDIIRDGEPIFRWFGDEVEMADVIAIPLQDAAFDQGGMLHQCYEIPMIWQPTPMHGHLRCYGWPDRGGSWPYDPPCHEGAEILTDIMATHEGPHCDGFGFSGSPAFDDSGKFFGMRIGHGTGRTLYISACSIWDLIHGATDGLEIVNTNTANAGRLGGAQIDWRPGQLTVPAARISGTLSAANIEAESISTDKLVAGSVVTEKLESDAVTKTEAATGTSSPITVSMTTTGMPVLVIAKVNAALSAQGTVSASLSIDGGSPLDTAAQSLQAAGSVTLPLMAKHTPSAGSHTWSLACGDLLSGSISVTELKR